MSIKYQQETISEIYTAMEHERFNIQMCSLLFNISH
jgi:hypothetical protein